MTDPETMLAWLDRRINSVTMWLSDHGRTSKKPRPEELILIKEEDLAMFEEIKRAYTRALDNKRANA